VEDTDPLLAEQITDYLAADAQYPVDESAARWRRMPTWMRWPASISLLGWAGGRVTARLSR
jgi:hypothetical protein